MEPECEVHSGKKGTFALDEPILPFLLAIFCHLKALNNINK